LVDVTSVLAPTATLSLTANMSFTRSKKKWAIQYTNKSVRMVREQWKTRIRVSREELSYEKQSEENRNFMS